MSERHGRHDDHLPPDDERAAERDTAYAAGRTEDAPRDRSGAPGAERPRLDVDSMAEEELRRLLRDSVRHIEPTPESLDALRHGIRARRARRRNVAVGAAVAILACSVGVPAMLHADFGHDGEKPLHAAGNAAKRSDEQHGASDGGRGDSSGHGDGTTSAELHERGGDPASGSPSTGGPETLNPSSSLGAISPACTEAHLGAANGAQSEPDAAGRIYGSFTVTNTSDASCTVHGDGLVLATAKGGTRSGRIQVVDHTAGDEATGLPDPTAHDDEVVLEPHSAYEVRFAWIPDAGNGPGCAPPSTLPGSGSDGPNGLAPKGPSGIRDGSDGGAGGDDTDASSGGTTGGTTGGGSTGGSGDDGTGGSSDGDEDAGPKSGIVVSYMPDAGEATEANVVLDGACSGTLYRTGALPAA